MARKPESEVGEVAEVGLQSQFREGELEREISSSRFQLATIRWIYSPVLVLALVAMVVGLILGWGSFGPVLGGAVGILGAVIALFQRARGIEEDLTYLIEKRDPAVLEARSPSGGSRGKLTE